MTHGVLIPNAIGAKNVDSWGRTAITAADDIDNGWVVYLSGKSTTSGESEVWTAVKPATAGGGSALTDLWMAGSPEIVGTASGSSFYRGLNDDPRNFYNLGGHVFDVYKPQLGDIITLTDYALCGTYIAGTTTHVAATNGTTGTSGGYTMLWVNAINTAVLCYKLLVATYISIGSGAIDNQRVTAYQFECVAL
jgi:hypothetical protein